MSIELPPFNLLILQLVLVEVLNQPLDFCGLEQTHDFKAVPHEVLSIARQLGNQ